MGRDSSRSSRRSSSRNDGSGGTTTSANRSNRGEPDVEDQLQDIQTALSKLSESQSAVADALSGADASAPTQQGRADRPLVSSAVVSQGEELSEEINVPKDGKLTGVYLSFPDGANQSLGIGIRGVDSESLIPFGPKNHNYIALSDIVVEFDLDYRVEKGEDITVEYVNNRNTDDDGFLTALLVLTEDG